MSVGRSKTPVHAFISTGQQVLLARWRHTCVTKCAHSWVDGLRLEGNRVIFYHETCYMQPSKI